MACDVYDSGRHLRGVVKRFYEMSPDERKALEGMRADLRAEMDARFPTPRPAQ